MFKSINTLIFHILWQTQHLESSLHLESSFMHIMFLQKMLIFSYNNAQIHPNVTVQYLKSTPFCPESMNNERSYFGFRQKSDVFSN